MVLFQFIINSDAVSTLTEYFRQHLTNRGMKIRETAASKVARQIFDSIYVIS